MRLAAEERQKSATQQDEAEGIQGSLASDEKTSAPTAEVFATVEKKKKPKRNPKGGEEPSEG